MTMTTRVLPPATKAQGPNPCPAYGQSYSCAVGSTLDVPDHVADQLCANGWLKLGQSGNTASRPKAQASGQPLPNGYLYIDTTLSAVVIWDQTQWRSPVTGAVV